MRPLVNIAGLLSLRPFAVWPLLGLQQPHKRERVIQAMQPEVFMSDSLPATNFQALMPAHNMHVSEEAGKIYLIGIFVVDLGPNYKKIL